MNDGEIPQALSAAGGEGFYTMTDDDIGALLDEALERSYKKRERGRAHPSLGEVLRKHRTEQGYSIASLARESEWGGHAVDHTLIGKVEAGQRGLGLESLSLLTAVLGWPFLHDYVMHYLNAMGVSSVALEPVPVESS